MCLHRCCRYTYFCNLCIYIYMYIVPPPPKKKKKKKRSAPYLFHSDTYRDVSNLTTPCAESAANTSEIGFSVDQLLC